MRLKFAFFLFTVYRVISGFNILSMNTSKTRDLFFENKINICIYTKQNLTKQNFSIEHIIPKCYMPKNFKYHKFNLYPCDVNINRKRSNYKFEETPIDLIKIVEEKGILFDKKKKCVYINNESKGIVARKVIYFTYLLKINFDHILDYNIALRWSIENLPTNRELKINKLVLDYIDNEKIRQQ